ncbi:MAG: septum site-determining protein Ssd [Rhodococcus sp. (in: high G+C Gram-positive bacteria)]
MDIDRTEPGNGRACLLLTDDAQLRAEVFRVAAAADCVVQEQNLPVGKFDRSDAAMRLDWEDARVVLLDAGTARRIETLRLPRRSGVVVLASDDATVEHWRSATAVGASRVLELPGDEEELIRLLGSDVDDAAPGGGVISVVGAKGGAGASTLAAALALSAASASVRTLLVDGDYYGGGLDLLLGWEDIPGLRWPGLVVEAGRISGDALHRALPSHGDAAVLSSGRAASGPLAGGPGVVSSAAVVDAGRRAGDLVVCDVPRVPGPETDVFHDAADLVVLVVPADLGSVAAGENIAGYLTSRNSNVGLVVRGPAPGGLRVADIVDALQLPLLACMRPEPGLARRVEKSGLRLGRRSPLGSAASAVLGTFARKPQGGRWAA